MTVMAYVGSSRVRYCAWLKYLIEASTESRLVILMVPRESCAVVHKQASADERWIANERTPSGIYPLYYST